MSLRNPRAQIAEEDVKDSKLIATIGCYDTCEKIVDFLKNRLSQPQIPVLIEHQGVNQYFHDMKLRP